MLDDGTNFFPVWPVQSHEVIEDVTLEDFPAKSREKGSVEESRVFCFFQVDDPRT